MDVVEPVRDFYGVSSCSIVGFLDGTKKKQTYGRSDP
jgi:hypothetical protein